MQGIEELIKKALEPIYNIIYILLFKIKSDKEIIDSLMSELDKKKEEVYTPFAMSDTELLEKWFSLNQEIQRRNKQNAQIGDSTDNQEP